jgi:cysteine-rich repeat protein
MRRIAYIVSIVWLLVPLTGCLDLTVPTPDHEYQQKPDTDPTRDTESPDGLSSPNLSDVPDAQDGSDAQGDSGLNLLDLNGFNDSGLNLGTGAVILDNPSAGWTAYDADDFLAGGTILPNGTNLSKVAGEDCLLVEEDTAVWLMPHPVSVGVEKFRVTVQVARVGANAVASFFPMLVDPAMPPELYRGVEWKWSESEMEVFFHQGSAAELMQANGSPFTLTEGAGKSILNEFQEFTIEVNRILDTVRLYVTLEGGSYQAIGELLSTAELAEDVMMGHSVELSGPDTCWKGLSFHYPTGGCGDGEQDPGEDCETCPSDVPDEECEPVANPDDCEPSFGGLGGGASDPTACWQIQAAVKYPDPSNPTAGGAWQVWNAGQFTIEEGSDLGPTCYKEGAGGNAGVFLRNATQHQAHYGGSLYFYLDEESKQAPLRMYLGSDFEWKSQQDGLEGVTTKNGPKFMLKHEGGAEPKYVITLTDAGKGAPDLGSGEVTYSGELEFVKSEHQGTWMRVEWEVDRQNDPVTFSLRLISMGQAGADGEIPIKLPPTVLFAVHDWPTAGSSDFSEAPWIALSGSGCIGEVAWYRRRNLCSNGKVDGVESCDDGNFASGDGCSSSCEIEDVPQDTPPLISKSCSEYEGSGGTGNTWIDPDLLSQQNEANETEGRSVHCKDGWMDIARNDGSTHFVSEHYLHGYRTLNPTDGNTESYVHPCTFVEAALGAATPQDILVRLKIGGIVDYFRPTTGSSLCQMLSGYNAHEWFGGPGGAATTDWFTPPTAQTIQHTTVQGTTLTSTRHLGGSAGLEDGCMDMDGDEDWCSYGLSPPRMMLSFWGGDVSPGGVFYGGCGDDKGPEVLTLNQPFVLSAKKLDEGETAPESGCPGGGDL